MTAPSVGFGPDRTLLVVGGVAGLAAGAGAAIAAEPTDRVVLAALALVLLGLVLAGLRVGRRLTVTTDGLVVRGIRGSRLIGWAEIGRISAPARRRLGIASSTLEIELVDEELLLFGRLDLGADPERVLAAIRTYQP